jgi:hypothetical protein
MSIRFSRRLLVPEHNYLQLRISVVEPCLRCNRTHALLEIFAVTICLQVTGCGMSPSALNAGGFQRDFLPLRIDAVLGREYKGGALGETVLL